MSPTRDLHLASKTPPATRPGGLPIEVLVPNGDRVPFNPGFPIPLGAAVHIVDPLKVHDTTQLHDLALISPWTPIAVTRSESLGFTALLSAWRADHRLTGLIVLKAESITAPHSALHAALRAGGPPSADQVAGWIHSRTESEALGAAVLGAIARRASLSRSGRQERFVKAGPLRAKGWTDAFRLAQALSHPCNATLDAIAGAVGREVRTLPKISDRLIAVPFLVARTGFGWRWAIEYILRQHGYLEDVDPVSLAVGLPSARIHDHAWWLHNNRKALSGDAARQIDA